MEAFNLVYLPSYYIVVCREHGYCLTNLTLKRHLGRLHGAKGEPLDAVLEELERLVIHDPSQVQFPSDGSPIPELPVFPGFQCALTACNNDEDALSQYRPAVEKHQARVHAVGKRKRIKPTPGIIREVSMQSLLPRPYYRPVLVRPDYQQCPSTPLHTNSLSEGEGSPSPSLHAVAQGSEQLQDFMSTRYESSQTSWASTFDRVPKGGEQGLNQTPPWILSTGISNFIAGLGCDKEDLQSLLSTTASSKVSTIPIACSANERSIQIIPMLR